MGFLSTVCCVVFNRLDRKNKKSPYFRRFGREPSLRHLRRFGCLAYAKVHTQVDALDDRAERGVFLGYEPRNSTYKIGLWRPDERTTKGVRFLVTENKSVQFNENVTISDINDLRPDREGTYVKFPLSSQLGDFVDFEEDVGPPVVKDGKGQPAADPGAGAADSSDDPSSESDPGDDSKEPLPK